MTRTLARRIGQAPGLPLVPDEGYREGSLVKSTAVPALVFDPLPAALGDASDCGHITRTKITRPAARRGQNPRTTAVETHERSQMFVRGRRDPDHGPQSVIR